MSGIQVSPTLQQEFNTFQKSNKFCMIVQIENDSFISKGELPNAGNSVVNWQQLANAIDESEPGYYICRDIDDEKKPFTIVYYCSDNAKVRSRMTYASSINGFKNGLGSSNFAKDYHASILSEITHEQYVLATAEIDHREIMTMDERDAADAAMESHKMSNCGVGNAAANVIRDLPIKVASTVKKGLASIASGSTTGMIAFLDMESEALKVEEHGSLSLNDIVAKLPDKEPRFIIFNFAHKDRNGQSQKAFIFIYYCPETARPRQKMFYSTSSSLVSTLSDACGCPPAKRYECSEKKEISESILIDELYPVEEVKKVHKKVTPLNSRKPKSKKSASIPKFNANI